MLLPAPRSQAPGSGGGKPRGSSAERTHRLHNAAIYRTGPGMSGRPGAPEIARALGCRGKGAPLYSSMGRGGGGGGLFRLDSSETHLTHIATRENMQVFCIFHLKLTKKNHTPETNVTMLTNWNQNFEK